MITAEPGYLSLRNSRHAAASYQTRAAAANPFSGSTVFFRTSFIRQSNCIGVLSVQILSGQQNISRFPVWNRRKEIKMKKNEGIELTAEQLELVSGGFNENQLTPDEYKRLHYYKNALDQALQAWVSGTGPKEKYDQAKAEYEAYYNFLSKKYD